MANPKKGARITSVRGFIGATFKQPIDDSFFYAYRGHRSESYELLPSVLRTAEGRLQESRIFQELLAASSDEFQNDVNTFQKLVRAQHYGLPTRLLDVTLNPLVALYFATSELDNNEIADTDISTTGEVVAFKVPWSMVKYSDSDSVSCISNLTYLTADERRNVRKAASLDVDEFNRELTVRRLHDFIRHEKPGFEPRMKPTETQNTYFVNPRDSNSRMIAQAGKFLIFGERVGYEHILKDYSAISFMIAPKAKPAIRQELDQLSINGRTLFPEVESAAKYIKAKFL